MEFQVNHVEELPEVAQKIIQHFPDDRVFLFYGKMGAGKTTLINALCQALEVEDATSSPTFSIVNEYQSSQGLIFHFDFYRLKSEEEAFDLGYEEYFYSNSYCFVEWPEKIPNLLSSNAREINITATSPTSRTIHIK